MTTSYTYEGGRLIRQEKNGERLFFLYDAAGLVGFDRITGSGTVTYYYRYDGKGEITALTDAAGNVVANYAYDAWGANLGVTDAAGNAVTDSAHIGIVNPFRYKGYYYDTETGLYYLNSRYYDPEVCRWISADIAETLAADFENFAQYNLFAYCFNNPVSMLDETGTWPGWATKLAIGVGAIVVGAAVVAATAATGGVAAAFTGALIAGVKTATFSGAVAAGTRAAVTAIVSVVSGSDVKTTMGKTASAAVDGFANGFMWAGIVFGASRAAGYITSTTGIFKRNVTYGKNNFMFGNSELTIWRHGPDFRIDASPIRGLHYHIRTASSGIGQHQTKWIPETIGVFSGLFSLLK